MIDNVLKKDSSITNKISMGLSIKKEDNVKQAETALLKTFERLIIKFERENTLLNLIDQMIDIDEFEDDKYPSIFRLLSFKYS